jgi:hypothetical protein
MAEQIKTTFEGVAPDGRKVYKVDYEEKKRVEEKEILEKTSSEGQWGGTNPGGKHLNDFDIKMRRDTDRRRQETIEAERREEAQFKEKQKYSDVKDDALDKAA